LLWCKSGSCGLLRERARGSGRMEGHFRLLELNVHADDVAAGSVEQLHGDLAQEPQADDDDGFAQGDPGHADGLQRDAAHGDEGGFLKCAGVRRCGGADVLPSCSRARNLHAQVGWYRHNLRVASVAGTSAGHPVADAVRARACPCPYARPHVYHHPGR
jgi:hypothetical protein